MVSRETGEGYTIAMNPDEPKLIELAQTSKKEERRIDFKERFDPALAADWSNIVKDIVAMANSGGGIIIFGITDDGRISEFDRKIVLELDPAVVSDKIHAYTGENFSEFKILEIKIRNKILSAILIFETQTPIVFTRNGADGMTQGKQKPIFLKGTIYFRHGAKSEPADTGDIKRIIDKIVNQTRKSWFEGVRKISNIRSSEEVIISKRNPALRGRPFSLSGLLKVSERGTPVRLSHEEFEALKKEYPLEYKDVLMRCKKKKNATQKKLQAYINSCKNNQDLSINWKEIGKSLHLPFGVPSKFMYKEKVVENY